MNEHYTSQMNFLRGYKQTYDDKKILLGNLKNRYAQLQPSVEEAEKIKEEIEDLAKSMRLDEKFLISMNDMVLRNTGKPISEGPLFESEERRMQSATADESAEASEGN